MMAIEFVVEFVEQLKKENTIMVMTHCDQAPPDDKYMKEKIKSYVDAGLEIQQQNLVQYDKTPESLKNYMQSLLKKGNMTIGGTEEKLP